MNTTLINERAAVKAGIDAWIKAVELRDNSLLPQVVAQDANLVWIGAEAGDWLVGFEELESAMQAQNAALEDIHIQVNEETIHFSPKEKTAWATNQWVFNAQIGEQTMALPLRCTWILEKRSDQWVIVHFHKSVGMPR